MDKKIAGLLGAAAALTTMTAARTHRRVRRSQVHHRRNRARIFFPSVTGPARSRRSNIP